jgi:hypothetical protein
LEVPLDEVSGMLNRCRDSGSRCLRPGNTPQADLPHQSFHGAAGNIHALTVQVSMHLAGTIDAAIRSMLLFDQHRQFPVTARPRGRLALVCRVVRRWGDRQLLADRLDPELLPVLINERDHRLCGRSSSAAKKAEALRRIAFARFTPRNSRSRAAILSASELVVPPRAPASTSA